MVAGVDAVGGLREVPRPAARQVEQLAVTLADDGDGRVGGPPRVATAPRTCSTSRGKAHAGTARFARAPAAVGRRSNTMHVSGPAHRHRAPSPPGAAGIRRNARATRPTWPATPGTRPPSPAALPGARPPPRHRRGGGRRRFRCPSGGSATPAPVDLRAATSSPFGDHQHRSAGRHSLAYRRPHALHQALVVLPRRPRRRRPLCRRGPSAAPGATPSPTAAAVTASTRLTNWKLPSNIRSIRSSTSAAAGRVAPVDHRQVALGEEAG